MELQRRRLRNERAAIHPRGDFRSGGPGVAPSQKNGRRHHLAHADPPDRRQGAQGNSRLLLRHLGLLCRKSRIRNSGRVRPLRRRSPQAGAARHPRLGGQPHLARCTVDHRAARRLVRPRLAGPHHRAVRLDRHRQTQLRQCRHAAGDGARHALLARARHRRIPLRHGLRGAHRLLAHNAACAAA